jgi:hypothetical protein
VKERKRWPLFMQLFLWKIMEERKREGAIGQD